MGSIYPALVGTIVGTALISFCCCCDCVCVCVRPSSLSDIFTERRLRWNTSEAVSAARLESGHGRLFNSPGPLWAAHKRRKSGGERNGQNEKKDGGREEERRGGERRASERFSRRQNLPPCQGLGPDCWNRKQTLRSASPLQHHLQGHFKHSRKKSVCLCVCVCV